MKILVEMRWLRSKQIDGIARFTLSIVSEWLRVNSDHHFILLCQDESLASFILNWIEKYNQEPLATSFEIVNTNLPISSPQNLFKLKKWLNKYNPDIFYSPYYHFYLPKHKCTTISTIHDLIPLRYPELFNQASLTFKLVMRNPKALKKLILRCDKIITISQSTRQDLKHLLEIPNQKMRVVHLGVAPSNHDLANEEVLKQYRLQPDKKYITCISRHEPYKNILTLIQAYSKLPETQRIEYPLLLVGPKNKDYTPVLSKEIQSLNLSKDVFMIGSVDTEDLPYIYQQSILYICPSLYEGFGLPVLEAMSHGIPVLASNTSSIPEVLGEAGLLFDPEDATSLTQHIINLLENEQELKRLSMQGVVRASHFTWKKTASHLMTIFKESFEL